MLKNFKSIGEIIKEDPGLAEVRKMLKQGDIPADFDKIFPDLKKIAKAVKVEKKILFLRVENASWRSELKFKEQLIVDKVNDHYKENRIKYVRFVS